MLGYQQAGMLGARPDLPRSFSSVVGLAVLGWYALKMASGRTAVETLLPACECWVSYAEQLEPGSFCSPREVAG